MNILMLDKSPITDRRIILEAESLIAHGHEVVLYTGRSDKTQAEDALENQLRIKRFFYYKILDIYEQYFNSIHVQQQLAFTLSKQNSRSKLLAILYFFIKNPNFALIKINQFNLPFNEWLKNTFCVFLALLSRNRMILTYYLKNLLTIEQYWSQQIYQNALHHFRPDVIHCHDFSSLKDGIFLAKKFQVPLLYDAHELYSYQPGIPPIFRKVIFKKEKKLIHHCYTCITVNQQQAEIMQKDFNYHRFVPVTNATQAPKNFDPQQSYQLIRQKTGIPLHEPIILFQGLVNRLRKIDLLIQGLAQVEQKIHLVFLTYSQDYDEFEQLAKDLNIAERVHFLDPVPWEDMIFWAASADVGVLPYQADDLNTKISSPNKLYEFICATTPMIASTDLINVKDIIEKEAFGVIYPLKKPNDYARAIEIMFDPTLGGPQRFKQNLIDKRHLYTWEHEEKKLVKLYEHLENTMNA